MKEGFDSLSQLNSTDETTDEDTLLKPEPAPGDSSSAGPAPAPSKNNDPINTVITDPTTSKNNDPINTVITDPTTNKESFQTRDTERVYLPKRNKPKSEGVFEHIFTDKKSDFKLKHF
jgi:hypothetical protein